MIHPHFRGFYITIVYPFQMELSQDVKYFILVSILLILPKALMRFRIPAAITAMVIGATISVTLGWFKGESTLYFLSVLGISSLFLLAGLEVDFEELKRDWTFFIKHLIGGFILLGVATYALHQGLGLNLRPASLLALGLLTPSTGFILDSIHALGLSQNEERWVRSMAIAMEMMALLIMFFVLQSESVASFGVSLVAVAGIILALPLLFRFFFRVIAPFAPQSEFSFLILLALLCGVLTRNIGTYYLIGAFIVGLTARRFERYLPLATSKKTMESLQLFFSFFIPFYFFKSGLAIDTQSLSWKGLLYGLMFIAIATPVRIGSVFLSLRLFLKDQCQHQVLVSISTLPTLVFGLVIAEILRTRFQVPPSVFTGLIIYTVVVSMIPAYTIKKMPQPPPM